MAVDAVASGTRLTNLFKMELTMAMKDSITRRKKRGEWKDLFPPLPQPNCDTVTLKVTLPEDEVWRLEAFCKACGVSQPRREL